jgi:hypothetical protein
MDLWINLLISLRVVETLKLKGQKGVIVDKMWRVFHRFSGTYPQP